MSYRKIKIYVSASFNDKEKIIRFKKYIDNAHDGKYEITCRWWDHTGDDSITYALEDLIGVRECDIFILYNGSEKTSGKIFEFGMAVALGKTIKIYGNPLTTVFRHFGEYCGLRLPRNLNDEKVFKVICKHSFYGVSPGKQCVRCGYCGPTDIECDYYCDECPKCKEV